MQWMLCLARLAHLANTCPCTEPCCAVDSALIHYLLEHPEGGEMAFWAADRSSV